MFFVIPPPVYCRIYVIDPLKTRAVPVVVVDDPAGLQMGVDRDRAHILETALFQVFADPVGQTVADRDRTHVMSLIQDGFAVGIRPNIIAKAPIFLLYLPVAPGVVDHCLDLAR